MLPDGSLQINDTIIRRDQVDALERLSGLATHMLYDLDVEKRAYLNYGLATDREG